MERSTSDEILSVIEAKLQILGFKLVNKVKNLTNKYFWVFYVNLFLVKSWLIDPNLSKIG